jgi:hypothetical protein
MHKFFAGRFYVSRFSSIQVREPFSPSRTFDHSLFNFACAFFDFSCAACCRVYWAFDERLSLQHVLEGAALSVSVYVRRTERWLQPRLEHSLSKLTHFLPISISRCARSVMPVALWAMEWLIKLVWSSLIGVDIANFQLRYAFVNFTVLTAASLSMQSHLTDGCV